MKTDVKYLDAPNAYQLTGTYIRWSLAYGLLVLLFWMLGFEGIYEHLLPFYARVHVSFRATATPLAALCLMLTIAMAMIKPWRRREIWIIWSMLLVLAVGSLVLQRPEFGVWLGSTVRHSLPVFVFCSFLSLLLWYDKRTGLLHDDNADRSPRRVLLALFLFSILFSITVALMRHDPNGLSRAYSRTTYEYIGDIGVGGSLRGLFNKYTDLHARNLLSMHAKVHPPGPIAILWIMSYAVGRNPMPLSVATVIVGALGVFPFFAWARELTDKRTALVCTFLYALVPSVVLFTATSADILFTPITLTMLWAFERAIRRGSLLYALLAGLLYAVLSLTSFSLIGLGAYFGLVGLWRLRSPETRGKVIKTAILMISMFLSFHVLIYFWSRFNIFECFAQCKTQFETDQYHLDRLRPRFPSWSWRFLNPACWLFFAGMPITILFFERLRHHTAATRPLWVIFLLTLLTLDILYLARGEGERSALYLFPFLVIPAGHLLSEWMARQRSVALLGATLAFLAFQSWLMEVILYTYW